MKKYNAKYTPGLWKVAKMDNGYGFQIINEKGNHVMGSIASNGAGIMGQSAMASANAKLIAAAPDMAGALKALLNDPITSGSAAHYRDQCKIKGRANPIELARAALAKAGMK